METKFNFSIYDKTFKFNNTKTLIYFGCISVIICWREMFDWITFVSAISWQKKNCCSWRERTSSKQMDDIDIWKVEFLWFLLGIKEIEIKHKLETGLRQSVELFPKRKDISKTHEETSQTNPLIGTWRHTHQLIGNVCKGKKWKWSEDIMDALWWSKGLINHESQYSIVLYPMLREKESAKQRVAKLWR